MPSICSARIRICCPASVGPLMGNLLVRSPRKHQPHPRHSGEQQSWLNEPLSSREIRTNSSSVRTRNSVADRDKAKYLHSEEPLKFHVSSCPPGRDSPGRIVYPDMWTFGVSGNFLQGRDYRYIASAIALVGNLTKNATLRALHRKGDATCPRWRKLAKDALSLNFSMRDSPCPQQLTSRRFAASKRTYTEMP
jgi:hypothetical protein